MLKGGHFRNGLHVLSTLTPQISSIKIHRCSQQTSTAGNSRIVWGYCHPIPMWHIYCTRSCSQRCVQARQRYCWWEGEIPKAGLSKETSCWPRGSNKVKEVSPHSVGFPGIWVGYSQECRSAPGNNSTLLLWSMLHIPSKFYMIKILHHFLLHKLRVLNY